MHSFPFVLDGGDLGSLPSLAEVHVGKSLEALQGELRWITIPYEITVHGCRQR